MTYPVFATGDVLPASDMNAIGLWLVKTQTIGSAVSSVTVTGAFSSSYDNYRIVFSAVDASADAQQLRLTFGATGGVVYSSSLYYDKSDGLSTGFIRVNNGAYGLMGLTGLDDNSQSDITVYSPNLAKQTGWSGTYIGGNHGGWCVGRLADTTQYTAFTITVQSGTLTGGTIRVYGYRN